MNLFERIKEPEKERKNNLLQYTVPASKYSLENDFCMFAEVWKSKASSEGVPAKPTKIPGIAGSIYDTVELTYEEVVERYGYSLGHSDQQSPTKKGKNMYIEKSIKDDKSLESSRVNYLLGRLEDLTSKLENPLSEQFHIDDDTPPKSPQELVDRIVAGKFTFKEVQNKDKSSPWYRPVEGILWRDPAVKADEVGHKAAVKSLYEAKTVATDAIMVGTPADGLAALQAFEKWTPTPTTTVQ